MNAYEPLDPNDPMGTRHQTEYSLSDQEEKLGPPPWHEDDPAVQAWEAAHGHDVRLDCYVEYQCMQIEPAYQRRLDATHGAVVQLREVLWASTCAAELSGSDYRRAAELINTVLELTKEEA